jgi:spermidine synthase
MRTFLDVFPEATLWFEAGLMVGSKAPLRIDPSTFDDKRRDARTRAALDDIGLAGFETLRSWYTAGPEEMRRFVGPGPVLTDDQPLVEYYRSLPARNTPLDLTGLAGDVSRILRP